jgi:hypothetical protein
MSVQVPRGLSRRSEVTGAVAVLAVLIQLILAQLTLAFAVLFVIAGHVSRWRRSWLLAPAAVGLVWALAAGPGHVIAGFLAGPVQVLSDLGHGHVLGGPGRPLGGFSAASSWLPRQLPVALVAGAAEAAVIGWLTGPRSGPGRPTLAPRPGAVAVLRSAVAIRMIRAGAVLTRNGCALGVVRATGAVAELRWAQMTGGVVVTGPAPMEVTVTCLQVVHAALRRRKPLVVIDPGDDPAIARALAAACAATGTPLRHGGRMQVGADPGASSPDASSPDASSPDAGVDLVGVVSDRSAVLLPADSPSLAELACTGVARLAAELRRIGVDGDGLVWVPSGESLPGPALAGLIRDGGAAGLPVLIGTTSAPTVTELAGAASAVLTFTPQTPARKPWQFSLVVSSPRRRELPLAQLIPARLPTALPACPAPLAPAPLARVASPRSLA